VALGFFFFSRRPFPFFPIPFPPPFMGRPPLLRKFFLFGLSRRCLSVRHVPFHRFSHPPLFLPFTSLLFPVNPLSLLNGLNSSFLGQQTFFSSWSIPFPLLMGHHSFPCVRLFRTLIKMLERTLFKELLLHECPNLAPPFPFPFPPSLLGKRPFSPEESFSKKSKKPTLSSSE